MSAELLREAAALMRERALAADGGEWEIYMTIHAEAWVCEKGRGGFGVVSQPATGRAGYGKGNAVHIASWDPVVALAVAKVLEDQADIIGEHEGFFDIEGMGDANCLAIALAYLGRDT